MQRLRRFARYWDLAANSGNFVETTPLIWGDVGRRPRKRKARPVAAYMAGGPPDATFALSAFMRWSEWLHSRIGRTDSIALVRLMELLFEYLTNERNLQPLLAAETLWRDYQRGGRHDKPSFLKEFLKASGRIGALRSNSATPKRQARFNQAGRTPAGDALHPK